MPRQPTSERNALMYLGIFFLFSPFGCLLGLMPEQPWGWGMALLSAFFGGLIATGWSYAGQTRRTWMIIPLIVVPALSGPFFFKPLAQIGLADIGMSMPPFYRRLLLMVLAVTFIAIGFTLIVRFMREREQRTARLQTELDLAARIHQSLVPPIDTRTPFVHVYGKSEPSSEMGGDLIDLAVRDTSADLYLADISGHGVRAGVLMAMVKSALRASLLDQPPALDAVARTLNRVMSQVAEPDMFATFACLRIHSDRRIDYSIAGHWPILHLRAASRDLAELPGDSMPLGVDAAEGFISASTTASAGDTFVLLTDGLLEVMNKANEPLGLAHFKSRLLALADRPLPDLYQALLDETRAFGLQSDDQSLLLARVL